MSKTKKRLITAFAAILFIAVIFFLLRGPYLSNYTKRLIIPVLEDITKERIIIDKAVINLFPFYIQAKGFKMFDKDGNKLIWITKTRAYIDVAGIFSKELRIRKLTLKEPDVTADEVSLQRIIENVKKSLSVEDSRRYKISFSNIEFTDGRFNLKKADGLIFSGEGLFFGMTAKNQISAQLRLNKGKVRTPEQTIMKVGLDSRMKITDKGVELTELNINSSKSGLHAQGDVHFTAEGGLKSVTLNGNAKIYEDVINKLFGVKSNRDDVLTFDGSINMSMDTALKQPQFTVDLKTESQFYLETLMNILKVKENITGKVSVKGEISGTFPEFTGSGTARLKNAVFDTLQLDDAEGEITYRNNKFSLNNFTAHTYKGEMKGNASLLLPHGDYAVEAAVLRVSSPEFFKFIKWEPPFPAGEINGHYQLRHEHEQDIEVRADVNYLNTSVLEGNVFNRLQTIKVPLHLKEELLTLYNAVLSTAVSDLILDGSIDLKRNMMNLDVKLDSRDVSDLTAPHLTRLAAPGTFKGRARGSITDPEISGNFDAGSGNIYGMMFTGASADLLYKVNLLSVPHLNIKSGKASCDASGSVEFGNAKGLFHFNEPFYKAKAAINDVDIKPFIKAFYKDIPVTGAVNGLLSFEGDSKNFRAGGDLVVQDAAVYGQQFEKVLVKTTVHPNDIEFHSVSAQKGTSLLDLKGNLSFDKKFNFSGSSSKINLSDINVLQQFSIGGSSRIAVKGSGTFDKPDISITVDIPESTFKGVQTGRGQIEGLLRDDALSVRGNFINGLITAAAKAVLSEKVLWDADVEVRKGSYNFLLSGFMKKVPKDLALTLEGKIKVKGEGENISLLSKFGYLTCNLYGYNLRNSNDIVLELSEKELRIKSFSLTGDNAKLSAEGVLKLREQVNAKIKGSLNLAPLITVSDKLAALKGQGDFVVDIAGPWDVPDVTGEININEALASLNEYPYKVGPLNGTVFLKKDRFTFDSVKTSFGGGSVILSGVGYLKGLSIKRIFISSAVTGITVRPMQKVSATVDGKLFYETSEKGAFISGNIDIRKARYEKNVEWNKWLISLKEINKDTLSYPAFFKNTEFNVYLTGADNIVIDNNIAKTPVKMALNLTGRVGRFGLLGRVEAREGSIYFRSNEFKILEGSNVDFINASKIIPVFHIIAETYTGNYYVKLNLDGTMDKFTLSLFSEPPLSEMEILALLTIGQTGKESRGFESGIAASEAASVLTGGLQEVMQENIKNITGFERFMIEPHTTSTGAVGPKVTIGKRLLEDKLFVTYSTSMGTTEESILRLEYKLDKNISVIGSKDEIGSVGGDLKFRFEFK